MYHQPQNLFDLHAGDGVDDTKSWLSGTDQVPSSPSFLHRTGSSFSSASAAGGNFDPVLYNELVEIFPLLHSLIDQKPKASFTRRGSVVYTKTPSRDLLNQKTVEGKRRNGAESISKRQKDQSKNLGNNDDENSDNLSVVSRSLQAEKDIEELAALRDQLEDLQRKLSEKDDLVKSAEMSKSEMASIQAKVDEMKLVAAEKDSLLKSAQLQLSDAKIKLADKQAAVEKLQWEATSSNQMAEKLQKDIEVIQGEISLFTQTFEELGRSRSSLVTEDYDALYQPSDQISCIDDMDDGEMQMLEAAREAYVVAVAAAKQKPDEVSVAAAARARLHLQSLVLNG